MAGDAPRISARPARLDDEPAIQDLFEATFGVRRSTAEWHWRYYEAPEPAEMHVLELDGEVVGHLSFCRFETYLDGEPRHIFSGGDWMYRPELRGKGISTALLPTYLEVYGQVPISLDFPSESAVEALLRGPRPVYPLGRVPQWVRWHSGRGVHRSNRRVPRPIGWVLARAMDVAALVGGGRRRIVGDGWASASELDELSERLRTVARCVRVRSGRYLRWRWQGQPGRSWWMLTCRDADGRLAGWVVAGLDPSEEGVGRIVDLLAEDQAATTALLGAAHRRLVHEGADTTTCELLDPRPWAAGAMRRAGFANRGEGPVAMCAWMVEGHEAWGTRSAWYVTRGDTDFA